MNELGSFFPLFYNNVSIFPFCNSICEQKKKKHRNKMVLFTSINRTKNRKMILISQTFPLSKFPLSNSLPSSKHFLPHSGIFNEQGKVFFFSLSPLYLDTIIRGKNKLDLWTNEFKYSFSRYTLLAFDEMKIKRICKIRFVRDFSYLF